MKKIFLSICLLSLVSVSVSAYDWGGVFNNSTHFAYNDKAGSSVTQSNAAYLWLQSKFSDDLLFSSEVMYKYRFNAKKDYSSFENIFDIDLLKLSGSSYFAKGNLDFSVGRFIVSDITGSIFAQNSDGLLLKYAAKKLNLSLYTGYTGLLNAHSVSIVNKDGIVDRAKNDFYSLCKPYIPLSLGVNIQQLFLQQSVSIFADMFIDASGEKDNRFYATLALDGPLTQGFYYDFSTTFASYTFKELALYSKAKIHMFITEALYASVGFEYASGNNGSLKTFRTFSSRPVVSAYDTIETAGVMLPSLSLTGSFGDIYANFDAKLLLDCAESTTKVWGPEVVTSIVYNLFYDVQFGLDGVAFWDLKNDGNFSNYSATLKINIAF